MKYSPEIIEHGASVIICCYNSAQRLSATLQHLADQNLPADFRMEIIIVDNGSTDNTAAVARETWNKAELKNTVLKIVNEPRAGQMFARKTGVAKAEFECVVFCDDDNRLNKNYVFYAHQLITKYPYIGAGGGQNLPVTNAIAYPKWFEGYKNYYGLGIPAETSGDVSHKTFVLGAGMVTKKSLFLQAFDDKYPTLLNGRNGEKLSTGDDFEYCKRLLLWGYKLYYDEGMVLHHFIPEERLTLPYRERLMQGISDAGIILDEYDLAIRVSRKNKNKSRWRLLILAPFRILFAKLGWSKRAAIDEELTLFYLSPFHLKKNTSRSIIKDFIKHK
ncbi:MAG: glycosyltransferase family 2 protein [Bacteroidota bacterium]|nr:glycosyltransferase family 2 protein [Bacteroidota bacterium]